ncbi:MAG: hypothetical protein ONB05_01050, partial [candidate division KSB1 bacterium]|nr:hypothetical protein [candidate division KSB1 bacterium]
MKSRLFIVAAGVTLFLSLILGFNLASASEILMTPMAPLPQGAADGASAVVGEYIYYLGGYGATDTNYLAHNQRYNTITNEWTQMVPLPHPRWGLAAAYLQGSIYTFGGRNSSGFTDICEAYDVATNRWTSKTPLPYRNRSDMAVAIDDEYILLFKNDLTNGLGVYKFDPRGNGGMGSYTWLTEQPESHGYGAAAYMIVNGEKRVYLLNGGGSGGISRYYSIDTNSFSSPLPSGPYGGAEIDGQLREMCGWGNKVYLAMGEYPFTGEVWSFDVLTQQWEYVCTGTARDGVMGGIVNGVLFVAGGRNTDSRPYGMTVNEAFRLDTPPAPTPPPTPVPN